MPIRSIVEDWMVHQNRTQGELAEKLAITPGALTRKLNGDLRFKSMEIIVLADIMGMDPNELAEVAKVVLLDPHQMNLLVGVTGPSGSGKSWVCEQIKEKLEGQRKSTTHIHADVFYHKDDDVAKLKYKYDNPEALNTKELLFASRMLKDGHKILIPGGYDYSGGRKKIDMTISKSSQVNLIDGHLLLSDEAMVDMLDLIVWIEAEDSTCLERRIERDMKTRGKTRNQVERQYAEEVRPGYERFALPMREHYADQIMTVTNEASQESEETDQMIDGLVARILETKPSQRWPF